MRIVHIPCNDDFVNNIMRTLLSPVMTITRIPARRHSLMASMTSFRGGSNIPTRPTKVQFVCYHNSSEQGHDMLVHYTNILSWWTEINWLKENSFNQTKLSFETHCILSETTWTNPNEKQCLGVLNPEVTKKWKAYSIVIGWSNLAIGLRITWLVV